MKILKELRRTRKITQDKLSEVLGVSRSTISMWEIDASEPDTETVRRIANFFDVTADYLLGRTDDPNPLDTKKPAQDDINLDELEFALFGELRELDEEDKEELLKDARRMRELQELRKRQKEGK